MADIVRSGEETAPHDAGQSSSFQDHLVHALENASRHSDYIYEFIKHGLGRQPTALRLAVTMRDSLKQLSQLVRGEDLDTRDLRREREAAIYERIKALQDSIRNETLTNTHYVVEKLEAILTQIREDTDE